MATSPPAADLARKTAKPPTDPTQAQARAQNATLLGLAPELRNRIYEYALIPTAPIDLTLFLYETVTKSLGLLQACRQIRSEALALYEHNVSLSIGTLSRLANLYLGRDLANLGRERAGKVKSLIIDGFSLEQPASLRDTYIDEEKVIANERKLDRLRVLVETRGTAAYARSILQFICDRGIRLEAIEVPRTVEVRVGMTMRQARKFLCCAAWEVELARLKDEMRG